MKLINNRFKVIEKLDKIIGHQSYTVVDLKDGNKIKALTFFDYNKDRKLVAYYLEEFISLYNIKHKNLLETYSFHIVETIDDKRTNVSLYFLVHGLSQGEFLYLRQAELTKEDRINTLLDLMNLIDFLHFIGVTYKHLSPDNIFISSNEQVRVSSLGIIAERKIRLNYQTMTEHFIAPEIHQQLSLVEEKADYFSLGILMKYLLLKDYKAKNIVEKDFIGDLKFSGNEKKLLINSINNLTQYDPSKRNIKLRTHIDNLIEGLGLGYSHDFKSERSDINDRIKIQGRDLEIKKVLEHDDLLRNGSKHYSGIVFTGSKGSGKTRLLEEIDFQVRIRDRQNIRISVDSKDKSLNKNIIKLINASLGLASKDLINKYDLEFNNLFSSFVKEAKEDIYSSEFKNKYRLFNRISNYLIDISKSKLLYIFIDDIHNSNHEFLSLLKYLVKNLKDKNVFFVFSCLQLSMTVDSSVRNDILELVNLENMIKLKLENIKQVDFNRIIKAKFGFIEDDNKIISLLYNASEGNLLKLDYIVKDLFNKKEIYINKYGNWETNISDYKDEFRNLEIHHILRSQLAEISKESLKFINIASVFDKYIFEQSIVSIMNLKDNEKENIINELLENKIIKKYNDNGLEIYTFLNTELKRLLYHELDERNKGLIHEAISNFILKQIREDKINLENNHYILKELAFQLLKSNRDKLALELILKKAQIKKNEYHIKSIDLWELAYSLIRNDELYEKNYKTLYVLKNLIELYFLKGEKKDISIYVAELERIAKEQNNYYYLIKSKYYKAEGCFLENDLELVGQLAEEILDLSGKYNIIQGKIMGLYIKSKLSLNLNNWEMLLKTANELIEISKKHGKIKYLGNIYNILGLYYKYNGNANEAIKSYDKSIEFFTRTNNVAEVIKPINNIAGVYTDHLHDDDMAIYFFEKGYRIALEYNLLQGISIFSLNLGITYSEKFQFEKALNYLKKADEVYLYRKEFRGIFSTAIQLGITYLNKDDIVNIYNLYSRIEDMFKSNKILDVELTSAYYAFSSKFYGYFGLWDKALMNIVIAKEEFQKTSIKSYWGSFLIEIYYEYGRDGIIDENRKDIFFDIIQNYCSVSVSNEILSIILKFSQLSLINKDYQFTDELIRIYDKLKPIKEARSLKALRIPIENGIKFNEKTIKELEDLNLRDYPSTIAKTVHLNLGISFFNKKQYKKSIYHLLKSIGIMFKAIDYIEEFQMVKSFILFNQGDLIKAYVKRAIKLEFNKEVNYIKLDSIKEETLYEYFNLKKIIKILSNEELDSILYIYNENNKSKDIQSLLDEMDDDFEKNLDRILEYISNKTLAEKAFIITYDEKLNDYTILSSLNSKDVQKFNLNKLMHLDRKKEGILLNKNSLLKERRNDMEFLSKDLMGILGIPIKIENNKAPDKDNRNKPRYIDESYKGYIYLETESYLNKFNLENFNGLKSLSKLVYLNYENQMLKNISTKDKLTDTLNRKYFESRLEKFIDGNIETDFTFTLLMIDLDNFKQINDSYGHLKGDKVLKILGNQFKTNTRSTDLVCRYGGDEFIIALLNTTIEEGTAIAEKIRTKTEEICIDGIDKKISLTIGISHYPTHSRFKKELMKKGDDALYFAKHNLNKNSVVIWDSSLSQESIHLQNRESVYSGIKSMDGKIALNITEVTNLIRSKADINEKGELFLEVLLKSLVSDEAHLIFTNSFNVGSSITRYKDTNKAQDDSKYKLNIIHKALSNKNGGFFIDWEHYDKINEYTGAPDWKSIMYIPLVKNDNIYGIIYLSVSINEKEFSIDDFNLAKLLSDIFAANF